MRRARLLFGVAILASLAAILASLAGTTLAPSAQAAPRGDATMREVARHVEHGWRHDGLPTKELVERFYRGQPLQLTCGRVAQLGQAILARRGVASRLVVTMTRRRFNPWDNGHTMIEVRQGGRWVVYDLTNNRRAVDRRGRGVSVVTLVRMRRPHWQIIARNRRYTLEGVTSPALRRYIRAVFVRGTMRAWHQRVLGTPLIEHRRNRYAFGDTSQRDRLEEYSHQFRWVPWGEFRSLAHQAPDRLTPKP